MYFPFKYAFSNGLQVAETPSLDTIHFHIKGRNKAEWCKYSPNLTVSLTVGFAVLVWVFLSVKSNPGKMRPYRNIILSSCNLY